MHYHTMTIAGLERQLPICPVNENLSIGAFVIFGDAPLTVACAKALLERDPNLQLPEHIRLRLHTDEIFGNNDSGLN